LAFASQNVFQVSKPQKQQYDSLHVHKRYIVVHNLDMIALIMQAMSKGVGVGMHAHRCAESAKDTDEHETGLV
jgi:hypothetical protein